MTYVVDDKCIDCKHTTCVTVCPVDAIRGEYESNPFWLEKNAELCYTDGWEMIDEEKPPMEGYEEASKIENKTDRLIKHVNI